MSFLFMICKCPDNKYFGKHLTDFSRYGNNFANLGTLTNTPPGQYYIVRSCIGDHQSSFAQTLASTSFTPAQEVMDHPSHGRESGDNTITMPTAYGIITLRILVENSTNVDTVVAIQKKFTLSTVHRPESCAPTLTLELLTSGIEGSFSQRILQLTARLASYNPPEVESDVAWVNSTLELAGIVNNTYTQPKGVDLKAAELEANKSVLAAYYQPGVRNFTATTGPPSLPKFRATSRAITMFELSLLIQDIYNLTRPRPYTRFTTETLEQSRHTSSSSAESPRSTVFGV
jgi:Protein of unknown function (DUF1254)